MKKILAILLAAMMVFALAACGDNNTTDPDKDNPGTSQTGNQGNESNNGDKTRSDWDYADYADYTDGVPEPEFEYTISGIINDQFSFKSKASADEISRWKQTLLDNGAEEVREGETWAVIDGAHLIEMNGVLNGEARIYISLDSRPVGGEEQTEQNSSTNPGGTEQGGNEVVEGEPWPENEFTSHVPKPENAIVISSDNVGDFYYGIVMALSFDDTYAYAEQLVAAGYKGDLEMLKSNTMFWATNDDGVSITLQYNGDTEVVLDIDVSGAN